MKKIVFVAKHKRTFVEQDFEILSRHYKVTRTVSKKEIKESDGVFCWFASKHAIKPLMLTKHYKKPFIIVTGGYDVAYHKGEQKYGLATSPILRRIPKKILKNSTRILAVSKFNMEEAKRITNNPNISYVPNGIPLHNTPPDYKKKEDIVITAGFINKTSYWRKGLNSFIRVADLMPRYDFYHIGRISGDDLSRMAKKEIKEAPDNMHFLGYVDGIDEWYRKAKVYCQLSAYESFGLSVIEAMDRGCNTVVMNNGALPEIVGQYGYVSKNDEDIIMNVEKAMKTPVRKDVHSWLKQYDIKKREKRIMGVLNEVM